MVADCTSLFSPTSLSLLLPLLFSCSSPAEESAFANVDAVIFHLGLFSHVDTRATYPMQNGEPNLLHFKIAIVSTRFGRWGRGQQCALPRLRTGLQEGIAPSDSFDRSSASSLSLNPSSTPSLKHNAKKEHDQISAPELNKHWNVIDTAHLLNCC